MSIFVYFAHPVDFSDSRTVVNEIAAAMAQTSLAYYDPELAFRIPPDYEPTPTLTDINRAVLSGCDAVVAYLPTGVRTIGVPREMEQAVAEGKPLLVLSDARTFEVSWALPQETDNVRHVQVGGQQMRNAFGWLGQRVLALRRLKNKPPVSRPLYVRLDDGAALPSRAYEGDAGFDLYATEEVIIPAGEFVDVPMGCAVQFPDRVWGMITGRSSTVRKLDLLVTVGIIDSGYRGPLFAGVRSLRTDDYTVKKGERLAQLIPFTNVAMDLHPTVVDVLTQSDRGEAGFGSSGA